MGVGAAKKITQGLESLGFAMYEVAFRNPLGLLLLALEDAFEVLKPFTISASLVAN